MSRNCYMLKTRPSFGISIRESSIEEAGVEAELNK